MKRIRYGNTPSRLIQPDLSQLAWLFEAVLDRLLPQDRFGLEAGVFYET